MATTTTATTTKDVIRAVIREMIRIAAIKPFFLVLDDLQSDELFGMATAVELARRIKYK